MFRSLASTRRSRRYTCSYSLCQRCSVRCRLWSMSSVECESFNNKGLVILYNQSNFELKIKYAIMNDWEKWSNKLQIISNISTNVICPTMVENEAITVPEFYKIVYIIGIGRYAWDADKCRLKRKQSDSLKLLNIVNLWVIRTMSIIFWKHTHCGSDFQI